MSNPELSSPVFMRVPDSAENAARCFCSTCPSFPSACKGEVLYCGKGKSDCDIVVRGCLCVTCPVDAEYRLEGLYFCNRDEIGRRKIPVRKKAAWEPQRLYQEMVNLTEIASTGRSLVCSMGSMKRLPYTFDDLHFVPAQVFRTPLEEADAVNTEIIVGPRARRPLKASSPIMISGMSLGATSRNVKLVISQVAAKLRIAYNSGEGGILDEEYAAAKELIIGQYTTYTDEVDQAVLRNVAAVEIRFGQGAYPGKGSYLPPNKMSNIVSETRGLNGVELSHSSAHHMGMTTPTEIKKKVSMLRDSSEGIPIGAKIGCGNVEKDVHLLAEADVDFIALDGFGGATGATELYVRENVGIPIIAALPRAARILKELGCRDGVTLIAGGGLRTSADFTKCLALGADAVYIATAALIAINCEQYRVCHTGLCPTGVTTQLPSLAKQLNVERGVERLSNFIQVSTQEIANLTRIVGKNDIRNLDVEDLVSMKRALATITGTKWLNGK